MVTGGFHNWVKKKLPPKDWSWLSSKEYFLTHDYNDFWSFTNYRKYYCGKKTPGKSQCEKAKRKTTFSVCQRSGSIV